MSSRYKNPRKPWYDLSGLHFGRLEVLSYQIGSKWSCKCVCGAIKAVTTTDLRMGKTRSCGCLQAERQSMHGMHATPTYTTWGAMLTRCTNQNSPKYPRYGGRGIKVCDRWLRFENFFADMGERPLGMTLDRIDNNGNYEPGNCRWATLEQQANNTRTNRFVEVNGQRMSMAQAERSLGIPTSQLRKRLGRGWSLERALKP